MKKILLIGRPDDTYTELFGRLSGHYTVRYGSSGALAASTVMRSFSPHLIVIRLKDTSADAVSHILADAHGIPAVILGTPDEAAQIPGLQAAAICGDSVQSAYDAVCGILPPSENDDEEQRLTVMMIDDDAGILRMTKTMLCGEFDMMLAPSGSKALKLLERKQPDVILLDYEMPEMNGLQTLAAIRENPAFARIPVIFLTGADTPDVLEKIQAANSAGYLIKPADAPDIKAAVRRVKRD